MKRGVRIESRYINLYEIMISGRNIQREAKKKRDE